jgi:hemoglobin/transferrin/lactoferrin receptor protein
LTGKYTFASPDNPLIDMSASGYWNKGTSRSVVLKQYCAFWMGPTCGMDFTGPVGTTSGYDLNTAGFDVHNASRFDAFGAQNTLTLGADAFHDDVTSVGSNTTTHSSYLLTRNGTRLAYGAFAQWLAEYGSFLDVIGALRFDGFQSDSAPYSSAGQRVSPKLTVAVTPLDGLTLYGTYAEGYRAPSINEAFVSSNHPGNIFRFIPNPNLKPEIGRTLEAGINAQYENVIGDGDQFGAKFNVFQNNVTDYIGLENLAGDPTCGSGPPSGCYGYINFANVVIRGIELETSYDAGRWFAQGNLAFLEGKDTDTDEDLATILPFAAGATVGARFFEDKLTVAPNWRYASASKDGSYDAYHLFGLTVAWQANKSTTASLVLDNITNQQYTPFMANNAAPGFSVKGALKVKLGAE